MDASTPAEPEPADDPRPPAAEAADSAPPAAGAGRPGPRTGGAPDSDSPAASAAPPAAGPVDPNPPAAGAAPPPAGPVQPGPPAAGAAVATPAPPAASAPRVVFGGVLMGLANLVPGISGGTMILAVGLYDRFIEAVADVTRLRLSRGTLVFLGLFALGAAAAILSCAGVAAALVRDHRWAMYALFVGMTLGGVPLLWRLCKPIGPGVVIGFLAALGVMIAQALDVVTLALPETTVSFAVAGVAGATSMVLPGISGAYVLLILGVYEVVIGSLSGSALRSDLAGSLAVLVPVGVGAVLGIALLSNLLKWLIARFSAPVHGALLGLLVGSVVGLWPFQEPAHPELADRAQRKALVALLEGSELAEVRAERGVEWTDAEAEALLQRWRGASPGELKLRSLDRGFYSPSGARIVLAALLMGAGFALTRLVGRGAPTADGTPSGRTARR